MSILIPVRRTLQETSLAMPKLMYVSRKVIRTFDKLRNIVERDSEDAFYHDYIFPAASEMLELTNEEVEIVPTCQTRVGVAANVNNNYRKFHGCIMKGSIEDVIATCQSEFINILSI